MSNTVMLVGRLASDVDENILISVARAYKNEEGIYENDLIPVKIFDGIKRNMAEYCEKGAVIGVRGRLEIFDDKLVVIAEKITFLSRGKKDNE